MTKEYNNRGKGILGSFSNGSINLVANVLEWCFMIVYICYMNLIDLERREGNKYCRKRERERERAS